MGLKSEELLESLRDLERSRTREKLLRIESEALLEGLKRMSELHEKDQLFSSLTLALNAVLEFEDAFILRLHENGTMSTFVTTSTKYQSVNWTPGSVFSRVLSGKTIAVFDIEQIPEWNRQPKFIRKKVKSALHIHLYGTFQKAILIITHQNLRHFGPNHVKLAKRFSPLAAQALRTLELQYAIVQRDRFFILSRELMAIINYDGYFKQINSSWNEILGYPANEILDSHLYDYIHDDDMAVLISAFQEAQHAGNKYVEARFKASDNRYRWLSCSFTIYTDDQLCYLVARDITNRIKYEDELEYDASHDALTRLFNRAEFLKRIKQSFKKIQKDPRYKYAVIFLDLNKFKTINDTLGHDVGDQLLQQFSDCLRNCIRKGDIAARIGGDEFTILLDDSAFAENAILIAKRIQNTLKKPFEIKDNQIKVRTSIGISFSTNDDSSENDIIIRADSAMYSAKNSGDCEYMVK